MLRGTYCGNIAEINFVKKFNSNKNARDYKYYLNNCNIKNLHNIYMTRVTTKHFSKLSNQNVMTRADTYLIHTTDEKIKEILLENDFYLDENLLEKHGITYHIIDFSGISVKMSDSNNYQILKLTPDSFKALFGEYDLGAGASIYCLRKEELKKNVMVFKGWKTTKENIIKKYCNDIPQLVNLNDDIDEIAQLKIYKVLKNFSNKKITEIINQSKYIQEVIFNGYHIYEEPYSASYFYKGEKIEKLNYIPFTVTTGSGRSKGNFTIVLKPKKEAI